MKAQEDIKNFANQPKLCQNQWVSTKMTLWCLKTELQENAFVSNEYYRQAKTHDKQ